MQANTNSSANNTETNLFMADVSGMDCGDENDSSDNSQHRGSHVVTHCPSAHLVIENASTFDESGQFCYEKDGQNVSVKMGKMMANCICVPPCRRVTGQGCRQR